MGLCENSASFIIQHLLHHSKIISLKILALAIRWLSISDNSITSSQASFLTVDMMPQSDSDIDV